MSIIRLSHVLDYDLEAIKLIIDLISFNYDAIKQLKEILLPLHSNSSTLKLIDGKCCLLEIVESSQNFKNIIEQQQKANTSQMDEFKKLIRKMTNYFKLYDEYYKYINKEITPDIAEQIHKWEEFSSVKFEKILTSPHAVMLSLKKKFKEQLRENPMVATKKIAKFRNAVLNVSNIVRNEWNKSCVQCPSLIFYENLGYIKEYCYFGFVTCLSFGPQDAFICLFDNQLIVKATDSVFDSSYFSIKDVPEQEPFQGCVDLLTDNWSYRVQFALEEGKNAFTKAFESSAVKERPHPDSFRKPYILPLFFEFCSICKEKINDSQKQFCESCGKWICKSHMQRRFKFNWSKQQEPICDSCASELQID